MRELPSVLLPLLASYPSPATVCFLRNLSGLVFVVDCPVHIGILNLIYILPFATRCGSDDLSIIVPCCMHLYFALTVNPIAFARKRDLGGQYFLFFKVRLLIITIDNYI